MDRRGRPRDPSRELCEQAEVCAEVLRSEVALSNPELGRRPQTSFQGRICQYRFDRVPERREVARIHEDPTYAVVDLVSDAADPGGDERASLPHRLRDGQPEPFREALLD